MIEKLSINDLRSPVALFCVGWAVILLGMVVSIRPVWTTFMLPWRIELLASIFLGIALLVILVRRSGAPNVSRQEFRFLILPITAFILWSGVSAIWAGSWSYALHHTFVWAMYLVFYLIVRRLIENGDNANKLLATAALSLAFLGILAAIAYLTFITVGSSTNVGIVYAKYGEQINTLIPLVVVTVLLLSGQRFKIGVAVIALLWLLIFSSLSRTNFVLFVGEAAVVAVAIFAIKQFHIYRRKMAVILLALFLAPLPLYLISYTSANPGIPVVGRMANTATITGSNNFRKLMAVLSLKMFQANPILGVGADNFGREVNQYRTGYSEDNPGDINLAASENDIPERSHNEFLQILAELGVVGAVIFGWFLAGIGIFAWRSLRQRPWDIVSLAAFFGVLIFLVSSLVTSYSFRLMQNGFVFFFVLAIAVRGAVTVKDEAETDRSMIRPRVFRYAAFVGTAFCLLLVVQSIVRVSSVALAERANRTEDISVAVPIYGRSIALDPENANAYFNLGNRYFRAGNYAEAAKYLRRAIDLGQAGSPTFSYLATAQMLSGDDAGAAETFREAAALYPYSTFVLTRYAFFLERWGNTPESARILARANEIDSSTARTWWTMMNHGSEKASKAVVFDRTLSPIMDLTPNAAIYAVQAEREIRFPEEKVPFGSFFSP